MKDKVIIIRHVISKGYWDKLKKYLKEKEIRGILESQGEMGLDNRLDEKMGSEELNIDAKE